MIPLSRRALLTGAVAAIAAPNAASAGLGDFFKFGKKAKPSGPVTAVDYIQVRKSKRALDLIHEGKVVRTYPIQLGKNPIGHKQFLSDGRTPEGVYEISARNPHSAYYLSLRINYPSRQDIAFAASKGRNPGGDIMIHGQPNRAPHALKGDWTQGCIAVSNSDMKEIWDLIPNGCKILIQA